MSAKLWRRHERFSKKVAADPAAQMALENERNNQREFMEGCLDLIGGRPTVGAQRADAERLRLLKLASEAKRRALVGADPLNITKHTKGKAPKQKLAADPIEHVGHISRTVSAISRLTGKNKLDPRQVTAADTYCSAFETVHASLGGAMDFDRVRGSGGGSRGLAEAVLAASQMLKQARDALGVRTTIILEQIVVHGHTTEECARLVYSYSEGQATAARDINYIGRVLREALTELGMLWHPTSSSRGVRSFRPSRSEINAGDAGVRTVGGEPYVAR